MNATFIKSMIAAIAESVSLTKKRKEHGFFETHSFGKGGKHQRGRRHASIKERANRRKAKRKKR